MAVKGSSINGLQFIALPLTIVSLSGEHVDASSNIITGILFVLAGAVIAGIAVYLASDASTFHTGDMIVIDGAYTIY